MIEMVFGSGFPVPLPVSARTRLGEERVPGYDARATERAATSDRVLWRLFRT
jgi:hypothetical protein